MQGFVVIEGLDGAGTTTQAGRLADRWRRDGRWVLATREPTDRAIGRVIRATLRGADDAPAPVVLPWMFAADRADHVHGVIRPAIASGAWVVSDRYFHSSLAYQSLTMPLEAVWELNRSFPTPACTVFLRLSVDACLERLGRRGGEREIYERREHLVRIAAAYDRVLRFLGERGHRIVELDGAAPVEVVAAGVADAVEGG